MYIEIFALGAILFLVLTINGYIKVVDYVKDAYNELKSEEKQCYH